MIPIVNSHEHIQSNRVAQKYLNAVRPRNIVKTVLLGSPDSTFINGRSGFFCEDYYNDQAMKIRTRNPESFVVFPTVNPRNPKKLERFKHYVDQGATGLKLYSGHSLFHDLPIDHRTMNGLYSYCERRNIPVILHVNTNLYLGEFEGVLTRFPFLKVICPHLCLSTRHPERLEYLLNRYPNLFTDMSFGHINFLNEALLWLSENSRLFHVLFEKYQSRILFGTDMVITEADYKASGWIGKMTNAYQNLLQRRRFTFFGLPDYILNGLDLNRSVLERIYHRNFERVLSDTSTD